MLDNKKKKEFFLRLMFELLKNKIKLKITKYSKKLQQKLNITKKDFENYIKLKEFNEKFKIDIKDINSTIIDIANPYCPYNLTNEGLEHLSSINFKEIKELDLGYNNISDITPIIKDIFSNL